MDDDLTGILKTGDVVEITGAFFKKHNGKYKVTHSPDDQNWSGTDYCMNKLMRDGTMKDHDLTFWPLKSFTTDPAKHREAYQHNKEHAKLRIISKQQSEEQEQENIIDMQDYKKEDEKMKTEQQTP